MRIIAKAAKAVLAGAVAGLSTIGGYLVNDTSLADVTAGQWVFAVLAALIALGGVYQISNKQP